MPPRLVMTVPAPVTEVRRVAPGDWLDDRLELGDAVSRLAPGDEAGGRLLAGDVELLLAGDAERLLAGDAERLLKLKLVDRKFIILRVRGCKKPDGSRLLRDMI